MNIEDLSRADMAALSVPATIKGESSINAGSEVLLVVSTLSWTMYD